VLNSRISSGLMCSVALAAAVVAGTPSAYAAGRSGAAPQDMGTTPAATTMTVSIILKLQNAAELDAFIAASVDPSSNRYHKFLSVN
jgi:subtilase family serine protease